jgi:hypothetical protein
MVNPSTTRTVIRNSTTKAILDYFSGSERRQNAIVILHQRFENRNQRIFSASKTEFKFLSQDTTPFLAQLAGWLGR